MKGRNQLVTGFKGSFENITVVKAKDGDSIIKGKITQMSNPNTPAQQAQRGKFGFVQMLATYLVSFLRVNWITRNPMHSSYNAFTSANLRALSDYNGVDYFGQMQGFKFTEGDLYKPLFAQGVSGPFAMDGASLEGTVTWNYNEESQAQDGTDVLCFLFLNVETGDWFDTNTGILRSSGEYDFVAALDTVSKWVMVAFFTNSAGTNYSDSTVLALVDDGEIL